MGRKIPLPKRHFGVRDPLQQRKEREEKIKDKINNPPKDFEQQEVSKKFRSFVKLKEASKSGKFKKAHTVDDDFKSTRIDMDGIQRRANESDQKFMRRVNQIIHQRRVEADFAAKYNVDIIRNQDTGEIKLKKKPKDEIEELMKKKRAESKSGKRKFVDKYPESVDKTPPKLTSLQKLYLKKNAKKKSQEDEKSRVFAEYQHEVIKFGETAQAPPNLVIPKKAAKNETVPRPGKRDLLLTTMLKTNESPTITKPSIKPNRIIKGPINKKGKRKNLPNSTRVALETERQNAVELYRQLKKKQPIVPIANKNIEDF